MICASFNGKPCTTIVSCNSPTNVSDETDMIITRYNELSSLVRHIPKYNVLIIGADTNSQIGKDENDKFSLWDWPNRNGEYLRDLFTWEQAGTP